MKTKPLFLLLAVAVILSGCLFNNAEVKYNSTSSTDAPKGEIAWFPLNGNLNDSTGSKTLIAVSGQVNYTDGIMGKALSLNGKDNYIVLSPGYHDTISVLFWLKTPNGINSPSKPTIFDYGNGAISATLVDGLTGATELELKQSEFYASSKQIGEENYLNTYYQYSLVYIEATNNETSFYFKGFMSDGNSKIVRNRYQHNSLLNTSSDLIYIGRSSLKNDIENSFLTGSIDEIHVFDHFLTEAELNHFNAIQSN